MSIALDQSGAAQARATLSQGEVMQQAQMSVMKKGMEMQENTIGSLVDSVSKTAPAASNPPNLGNNVDVRA
ncbi:MAG: YjfB family protein [Halothiobacillaceae bacterium]